MIFRPKIGSGFAGAISYAVDLNGRHDKDVRILAARGVESYHDSQGKIIADPHQLARNFRTQAQLNPKVKKCVMHLFVSYDQNDLLVMINNAFKGVRHYNAIADAIHDLGVRGINDITDQAMKEDALCLLERMKYDNTQYLIVRHSEKSNPHFHIILNMVDDNGKRLLDFQNKKRGNKICAQISLQRDYTWAQHKSVSVAKVNNPKEKVRVEICKDIFDITRSSINARALMGKAAHRGIEVVYSTDTHNGRIKGIGFRKNGFRFSGAMVDAALSVQRLFPHQVSSNMSFADLSKQEQELITAGGIVPGFNNQALSAAKAPEAPQYVREYRKRDEYHKAISKAENDGNRSEYIMHIAGLAMDPQCGPPEKRADDVSPYISDDTGLQGSLPRRLQEIIRIADEQARNYKNLLDRIYSFLRTLLNHSLNIKKAPITCKEVQSAFIKPDERNRFSGITVRTDQEAQDSFNQAFDNPGE